MATPQFPPGGGGFLFYFDHDDSCPPLGSLFYCNHDNSYSPFGGLLLYFNNER